MNHLSLEEQAWVREHPDDYSEAIRNDVADQLISANLPPVGRLADDVQELADTAETFSVREVAQRLSKFVQRAKAGETLTITVRGEPAAQLGPIQHPAITTGEENA